MEAIKIEGYWWLPDKPNNRLSGTLTIDVNNITLNAYGKRDRDWLSHLETNKFKFEIIRGISVDGKEITLLDCFIRTTTFATLAQLLLKPRVVLIGLSLEKPEQATLYELNFHCTNLQNWTRISGIKRAVKLEDRSDFAYKVENREIEPFFLGEFEQIYKISIHTNPFQKISSKNGREITIGEEQYIKIITRKNREVPLIQMREVAFHFVRFLEFAFQQRIRQFKEWGKTRKGKAFNIVPVSFKKTFIKERRLEPVEIFTDEKFDISTTDEELNESSIIIKFEDIKNRTREVFSRWNNFYKNYELPYNLYFSTFFSEKPIYVESHFIKMYQAMEAYFNFVLLKNNNTEPNAEGKLKAIWNEYKADFRLFLNDKEFKILESKFLKSFEIRHALMHHKPGKQDKAKDFKSMLIAIDGFRAIIEMWILKELGFDGDKYKEMVKRIRSHLLFIWNLEKSD